MHCSDLSKVLQTLSSNLLDPNELWEDCENKFVFITDMHAPQITKKVRSEYATSIIDTIKKSIYHGDLLKEKAVKIG